MTKLTSSLDSAADPRGDGIGYDLACRTGLRRYPARSTEVQMDLLDTDQVERYWEQLLNEYGGYIPGKHPPSLMEMIRGEGFTSDRSWALSSGSVP